MVTNIQGPISPYLHCTSINTYFVITAKMGIILKWIFSKWDGGMGWIVLAQDREVGGLL